MSHPEEKEWQDLEETGKKYEDILSEINKLFRQEVRKLGVKKNVIPTKYILPKGYITRLLEYPVFRRAWERKLLWIYLKSDDEREGQWHCVQSFPNIGGVPVEEGSELRVEIVRIPRRKRKPKCQA